MLRRKLKRLLQNTFIQAGSTIRRRKGLQSRTPEQLESRCLLAATFSSQTFATAYSGLVGIVADDFNSDGNADVAVSTNASGAAMVLFGNGTGTINQTAVYNTGLAPSDVFSIASGNLSGSAHPELVVSSWGSGAVRSLVNNGSGIFTSGAVTSFGTQAAGVTVGYLNGDANRDIVTALPFANSVAIAYQDPFGATNFSAYVNVGPVPLDLVVADFNGDGWLDIATANNGNDSITVLLNQRQSPFPSFFRTDFSSSGSNTVALAAADFTGDNRPDIAITNRYSNTVTVLANNGTGGFSFLTSLSTGSFPYGITAADLDRDGRIDIAIAARDSNAVYAYSNINGSAFAAPTVLSIPSPSDLTTADFDNDGRVDLVVSSQYTNAVTVLKSTTNSAPTNITLFGSSVPENWLAATGVGTLSATDANTLDARTFSLVAGTGDTDNTLFSISGNTLRTAAVFDYETKSTYSIRIRTADPYGGTFEKAFTINVIDVNEAPTNITLSATALAENLANGTTVGTFSTADPDTANTHSYSLVLGTGSTGNDSFTISGSTLQTAASFDFETKSNYSIRVRTADLGGLSFEKTFTVIITNVNESPTDFALSQTSIAENQASATTVGSLTTTDPDGGGSFTYSLVSGGGDDDNRSFNITGSILKTAESFNFEAKSNYLIRVRTTDAGGLSFEKSITITVSNMNEIPTDLSISASSLSENQPTNTAVGTLTTTDTDASNTFLYSLVTGTGDDNNASVVIDGDIVKTAAPFDFETKSSYSIRIQTVDQGGLTFQRVFTITVTDVQEDLTSPTSAVLPLPLNATSLLIPITVSGSDPNGPVGSTTSGVKEFDLYVAQDSGPFVKFATVPFSDPGTFFNATSNHTYFFRSVGRDNAGNEEIKAANYADAFIRVADLDKPITQVTSASANATGAFTLAISGSELGGSQLAAFDLYVSIDNAAAVLIGSVSGGTPTSGVYSATATYQGLADGILHTYRFYSRGRDTAGNVEDAPAIGDMTTTQTFAAPPALQATGIDVQGGARQRSYINKVDLLFNTATGVGGLTAANRTKVERFGLSATSVTPGTGIDVPIGSFGLNGSKLTVNFGSALSNDGFYRIRADVNGDGDYDDAGEMFEFYLLLGDANGDAIVDVLDTAVVDSLFGQVGTSLDGDLNGDGIVNTADKSFTLRSYRGRKLADLLKPLLDD